jgi:hypothetical protein
MREAVEQLTHDIESLRGLIAEALLRYRLDRPTGLAAAAPMGKN